MVGLGPVHRITEPCSPESTHFTTETRLVSVAKGKIVRRNLHYRRFSGQVLLASKKRDVSHLRDDSLHRTACLCRPLLDGQRSVRPAAGVFQLAELSRGAAGNAADELCGSRTAAAGRAA